MAVPSIKSKRRVEMLSIVFILVLPIVASADGGMVWKTSFLGQAMSGGQEAIILYFENRETLVLQTDYEGELADFSWIIPVPSPVLAKDVREADPNIFSELDDLTAPTFYLEEGRSTGCSCPGPGVGGGSGGESSDSSSSDRDHVEVLETILTETYEVNVLSAAETQDLIDWFDQNDYSYSISSEVVFEDYIIRGWNFLAVKIRPSNPGFVTKQSLPPIQVSFETSEPVFPLRISSISSQSETEILLHFVSDHRYRTYNVVSEEVDYSSYHDDETDDYIAKYRQWMVEQVESLNGQLYFVEYAGWLPTLECQFVNNNFIDDTIDCDGGVFITRFRSYYSPDLFIDDIYFDQDNNDNFFSVTVYITTIRTALHASFLGVTLFSLIMTYVGPKQLLTEAARRSTRLNLLIILCMLLL